MFSLVHGEAIEHQASEARTNSATDSVVDHEALRTSVSLRGKVILNSVTSTLRASS